MPIINISNYPQFSAINVLVDGGHIPGKVVIPQCAQIRLRWTLSDGKTAYNVLHGRYPGSFAGTVAQMNALFAQFVGGAPWTAYNALLAPATTFAGMDVRDLSQVDTAVIASNAGSVAGGGAGLSLPNETAVVATLRTGKVGPANRGRAYLPGFATSNQSAGDVIAAASMTAISNWVATWIGAMASQGYTLCIAQPARQAYVGTGHNPASHPARAAGTVDVTSVLVRDNHWDSQRRRGLK